MSALVQVLDLGRVAVFDWSLFLSGDLDADIELRVTNGVVAAGPGVVSVRVATDIGDIDGDCRASRPAGAGTGDRGWRRRGGAGMAPG